MAKEKLNSRLDAETIQRLESLSAERKTDISVIIDQALDAFEREKNLSVKDLVSGVETRVENLEQAIEKLVDIFLQKGKLDRIFEKAAQMTLAINTAEFTEKPERYQRLYDDVGKKIEEYKGVK